MPQLAEHHLQDKPTIPVPSTAKGRPACQEEPNAAAIASSIAADIYGLKIVCADIEDIGNNVTRFLVIGSEDAPPTGDDKTIILFSTAHKTGARRCPERLQRPWHQHDEHRFKTEPQARMGILLFVDFLAISRTRTSRRHSRSPATTASNCRCWAVFRGTRHCYSRYFTGRRSTRMHKPFIAGNWKMNTDAAGAINPGWSRRWPRSPPSTWRSARRLSTFRR